MRKRFILLVACLAILGLMPFNSAFGYFISSNADPALAGGSVIDFQSQTLGEYTSLTSGSVNFTALDNFLRIDNTNAGNYNTQGQYLDNTYSGFRTLVVAFSNPVQAFGFNWAGSDYQWTLTAYDAGHNQLETYNMPMTGDSNAGEFYGIAASNIQYVNLTNIDLADWVVIDNFTSSAGVVPLPGSLWLLGSSLLGLGGWRRFRKN